MILELCAGEGGATVGYQRAGHTVYAVDNDRNRLRRNPAEARLYGDAMHVVYLLAQGARVPFARHDDGPIWLTLADVDAVHASPPCQFYTRGNAGKVTKWPRSIPPMRAALQTLGKPYVIENVRDAEWDMRDPVPLCGVHV